MIVSTCWHKTKKKKTLRMHQKKRKSCTYKKRLFGFVCFRKKDIRLFCICNSFSFVRTYCILILLGVVVVYFFFDVGCSDFFFSFLFSSSCMIIQDSPRYISMYINFYINRACCWFFFCQVLPTDKEKKTY
jgi:hypothetical protein